MGGGEGRTTKAKNLFLKLEKSSHDHKAREGNKALVVGPLVKEPFYGFPKFICSGVYEGCRWVGTPWIPGSPKETTWNPSWGL